MNIAQAELIDILKNKCNERIAYENDLFREKRALRTKRETKEFLEVFMETIKEELTKGNKISLRDFGSFETITKEERNGRNPRTGESLVIPSRKTPKFRPGDDFKNRVNEGV